MPVKCEKSQMCDVSKSGEESFLRSPNDQLCPMLLGSEGEDGGLTVGFGRMQLQVILAPGLQGSGG